MRFLLSRACVIATAVALSTNGVSSRTICYPGCGPNDYAGFSSTLTPFTKSISLPKFDAGEDRILTKVTIRTKAFFTTDFWMTCTDGESESKNNCETSFGGVTSAGVSFGINPSALNPGTLRTDLPQYWGRWGGFRHTIPDAQYLAENRVGLKDDATTPFFIEYTYPFFDVPQFVPTNNGPANPELVWAYLNPAVGKTSSFYFASDPTTDSVDPTDGLSVTYGNDPPINEFYSSALGVPGGTPQFLPYGPNSAGGPATPYGDEVHIGKYTFDNTGTAFETSFSADDFSGKVGATTGGAVTNDMTAEHMLALFSDETSSGEQIIWETTADGFVTALVQGGNFGGRQETYGYSQMQIEYEYTGTAITTGDPQFSGFQGQSFQIHGYPGSYFHLMSAPQFQMNGRFAYIANGHCNYNHTACWTHPGTYIDDLAIIVDELLVRITAGAVGQGYSVRINDEPFHAHAHGMNETSHTDIREFVPTKFYDAATRLTVHLRSPLEIHVRTSLFALTIHNADHFFNIDSQLLVRPMLQMGRQASTKYPHPQNGKPWFPQFPIHGFIGQTWAKATYNNNKQYQGDVDDYVETRPYATESIYSQYFKKFDDKNMNWDN